MITHVDARFNVDQEKMTWVINGMLEVTISRYELYKADDYASLLREKLMPLAFLYLPCHDDPF